MKRIAVLGPESTGKSTLAAALAAKLDTAWVPEYARAYLEGIQRPYQEADLLRIAREQLASEKQELANANNFLICDTELTVLKIWSENSYGRVHPWILDQWQGQSYDHYLLTYIDTPWEEDPLREHPNLRDFLYQWYEAELTLQGWPFTVIKGSHKERVQQALAVVNQL